MKNPLNPLPPVTQTLNKEFRQELGVRVHVSFTGSFVSVRAEDPDGVVTMRSWRRLTTRCAELLNELGVISDRAPIGSSYHMDGCVSTWERS